MYNTNTQLLTKNKPGYIKRRHNKVKRYKIIALNYIFNTISERSYNRPS